jgi:hypothetical protein
MPVSSQSKKRRVLIASSHGLFARGLRSLLREGQGSGVEVVGVLHDDRFSCLPRAHRLDFVLRSLA